jgi:hypothetical protein
MATDWHFTTLQGNYVRAKQSRKEIEEDVLKGLRSTYGIFNVQHARKRLAEADANVVAAMRALLEYKDANGITDTPNVI